MTSAIRFCGVSSCISCRSCACATSGRISEIDNTKAVNLFLIVILTCEIKNLNVLKCILCPYFVRVHCKNRKMPILYNDFYLAATFRVELLFEPDNTRGLQTFKFLENAKVVSINL